MTRLILFILLIAPTFAQAQGFFFQGSGISAKNKVAVGAYGFVPSDISNLGFMGNATIGLHEFYQGEFRLGVHSGPVQSSYVALLGKAVLSVNGKLFNTAALFGFEHDGTSGLVLSPVASHYFDWGELYCGLYNRFTLDTGSLGMALQPGVNFTMNTSQMRWYLEFKLALFNAPTQIASGVRWFF